MTAGAALLSPPLAGVVGAVAGMPAISAGAGVVLRRVRDGAGLVKQVLRESRTEIGTARAEGAAKLAGNAAIPARYRAQMVPGATGEAVESTLRRVAQNPEFSDVTRTIAANLDRPIARGTYKSLADMGWMSGLRRNSPMHKSSGFLPTR